MTFDAHKNAADGTVLVAPVPPLSGTSLGVSQAVAELMPEPPFNMPVWAGNETPSASNMTIVRVTAASAPVGGVVTYTIERKTATEPNNWDRAIQVGDQLMDAATAKTFIDLEAAVSVRAPLVSPAFTGTPTAPTAAAKDNSTQVATDAFVQSAVSEEKTRAETAEALKAPLASPALTGTPIAPTAGALDNSTKLATTAYADGAVGVEKSRATAAEALLAPLASPTLTGAPAAPTPAAKDNTTKIATTAFTQTAMGEEKTRAEAAENLKAPLASPGLTGTPTAPTAAAKDNTTKIATDQFVQTAVLEEQARAETAEGLKAPLASPALTGVPTVPTAAEGTSTTQAASTAFVVAAAKPIVSGEFNAKVPTGTGLTLSAGTEQWLTGKLEENTVIKITPAAKGKAKLLLQQDGVGNRVLTIEDPGGHKYTPYIPTGPFASFDIYIECPDGANLYISVQGNPQTITYAPLTADLAAIKEQITLQVISGLAVPIGTSFTEIWKIEWLIFFKAANEVMDLKFGLTGPAGFTANWGGLGNGSVKGFAVVPPATKPAAFVATQAENVEVGTGIGSGAVELKALVFGGGTEGNVELKYAQNTSNAENLQILKGSLVEYVQVHA